MSENSHKIAIYPNQLQILQWMYEGTARALCKSKGINPDSPVQKGSSPIWHFVGYEAACAELPEGPKDG